MSKEKKKPLEKFDVRHGIHRDDDSMTAVETIKTFKNDQDALPDDQKPKKLEITDDEPFLKPIILVKGLKKKVLQLIKTAAGKERFEELMNPKQGELERPHLPDDLYLWNKLSDPNFHPNDYLEFESPSKFKFHFAFTTCKGVYLFENLNSSLSMEMVEEILEEVPETEDEGLDPTEEYVLEEPELSELPITEGQVVLIPGEDITGMKIHEVFSFFKEHCCKKLKDGVCHKRHFLIGMGDIVTAEKIYSGIHIYLYPDQNFDQVDVPEDNITDDLYFRFMRDKNTPGIQYARPQFIGGYIREFRALVD